LIIGETHENVKSEKKLAVKNGYASLLGTIGFGLLPLKILKKMEPFFG
jgi:hypothetical protein